MSILLKIESEFLGQISCNVKSLARLHDSYQLAEIDDAKFKVEKLCLHRSNVTYFLACLF